MELKLFFVMVIGAYFGCSLLYYGIISDDRGSKITLFVGAILVFILVFNLESAGKAIVYIAESMQ